MNKLASMRKAIARKLKIDNFTQQMMADEIGMARVSITHAEKWPKDHPKYKFYLAAYQGVQWRMERKAKRQMKAA